MKIAAFLGSPRKKGNTHQILSHLLNGAESKGATTETVFLHDMNVECCQGCYRCERTGKCVIQDGMAPIYTLLKHSDAVVIASPIYFHYVTAQTKILFDRLYCMVDVYHQRKSRLMKKRPSAIILTYQNPDAERYLTVVEDLQTLLNRHNFEVSSTVIAAGLDKKAMTHISSDVLSTAFDAGCALVK